MFESQPLFVQSSSFLKYSGAWRSDEHPYVTENLHWNNLQGRIIAVLQEVISLVILNSFTWLDLQLWIIVALWAKKSTRRIMQLIFMFKHL